jgi:hypothetical protein
MQSRFLGAIDRSRGGSESQINDFSKLQKSCAVVGARTPPGKTLPLVRLSGCNYTPKGCVKKHASEHMQA